MNAKKGWDIELPHEQMIKGLEAAFWPGRAQVVERDDVDWFFDGAHTPESIAVCAKWFEDSAISYKR